ncbi:MAG: carbon-nitrogen hydrolase family protein [Anaerolineales bacterium]|nr:carbon-nitrogen hydrolase family protein [Anaerolineales bacterium]
MARLFGIAAVQMQSVAWDAPASVAQIGAVVAEVARGFPWVQLLIFPELAASGAVPFQPPDPPEAWRRTIQPIPGPLTDELGAIARRWGKWLVPGSLYEAAGDRVYNTALVISPAGEIVARYRKLFPWLPYEAETTAGDEFCVFDIPDVGRFGLCICYDQWFPEVARTLTWLGAEVILQPTLTPTSDRTLELVVSQATAICNQCYFVGVNGLSPLGGGRSLIVDPDGRVLQQAGDHAALLTELLDLDHVTRTREFGTLGLTQSLKQLRDSGRQFPIYQQGVAQGEGFKRLGPLAIHTHLRRP